MAEARILIVEDDWVVAEDMKSRLKNMGYIVSAMVPYGEEAIKKTKSLCRQCSQTSPSASILDALGLLIMKDEGEGGTIRWRVRHRITGW